MIEVLEFIFKDFWHFAGSFLLLSVVMGGLAGMFSRRG